MRDNPIQFAVTREDPELEFSLIEERDVERVLLIASGGCTPLSIHTRYPSISQTLVDPNPHQLEHVRRKADLLEQGASFERFNVGTADPGEVNECGNFESLFRGMRHFLYDLVLPREEMLALFEDPAYHAEARDKLLSSEYWPVSLDMYFCDSLLRTMFGPEAVQNAPPGSYPSYFRQVFEEGLHRDDARNNYFLHHVFLGQYLNRPEALPPYLSKEWPDEPFEPETYEGFVEEREDLHTYDFVNLSNIYDWMGDEQKNTLSRRLVEEMKPGATLLIRQLNNSKNLKKYFQPEFEFDESLETLWAEKERSLFYSRYNIGRKT